MTRSLHVHSAGPGVTVQDFGRPGWIGDGLSRGGAADRLALFEGAALLGQRATLPALELAGFGGDFEAGEDLRIALTGAPMSASLDGVRLAWNASHRMPRGAVLSIGGVTAGCYGYLHVGGGFEVPELLGARSAHLAAGLGAPVARGAVLSIGPDRGSGSVGQCLDPDPRFDGGRLRVVRGPQTRLFDAAEIDRFAAERFLRDTRGNRMGVRFLPGGASFAREAGLSILSETVVPGDVQVTGDGSLFVLLGECQTTGGYPRIGTVIAADLPRIAQAPAGAALRFEMLDLAEGREADARERRRIAGLHRDLRQLIRNPAAMADLLSYQLVSGVTAGDDLERVAG